MNRNRLATCLCLVLLWQGLGTAGELPAIGLKEEETPAATVYTLVRKSSAGEEAFWRHAVAKVNGVKPSEWRRIMACDERDGVILVLLDVDDVSVELVQYRTDRKQLVDLRFPNARWVMDEQAGKIIKAIAPDQITSTEVSGKTRSYRLRKGAIRSEEDGTLFSEGTPGPD